MKVLQNIPLVFLAAALLFFSACEREIDVEVDQGQSQLVVDAFLNDLQTEQKIVLKQSVDFFTANPEYLPINGADVKVENNDGEVFDFTENTGGEYKWGDGNEVMIEEGKTYTLTIQYNNQTYTAVTEANPVPEIDSINYELIPGQFGGEDSYLTELVARDIPGATNYYWIRAYKNGVRDDRFDGINISVDGSFAENSGNDGQIFIPPISTNFRTHITNSTLTSTA